jgi:hypothetical protein
VQANFIIDGGMFRDLFSASNVITFTLEVGAQNLGPAGASNQRSAFESDTRITAGFGGAGGFFDGFEGGRYTATLSSNASANLSFSDLVEGGLDLGAVFDPVNRSVEIPFSLQSLDLGVLDPGDRLLLAYREQFRFDQDLFTEGTIAEFSDPFALSGSPLLGSLTLEPLAAQVPAPATRQLVGSRLCASTVVPPRRRACASCACGRLGYSSSAAPVRGVEEGNLRCA